FLTSPVRNLSRTFSELNDGKLFPHSQIFENEVSLPLPHLQQSDYKSDLSISFHGVGVEAFSEDVINVLSQPINQVDIEVKPDGILYLPEIKYRRILNQSFGPGGWGLVPRGPHTVINNKKLTREYALFAQGRFVSQARGEQDFFSEDGIPTATEGCKSSALMRCCKDLGISWELWDPKFIRQFKAEHVVMVQGTHAKTGQSKWLYRRKNASLDYPYKEEAPKYTRK
ncbi:mitochondrial genome maintenance MGM101-domain-containing protein, partial [Globomyces pollinis-pini]